MIAAAILRPSTVRAQKPAMPVIGFLGPGTAENDVRRVRAFTQGLREMGYNEGQNVAIEYRWAEGRYDQFPPLAAELVQARVNVIAAIGGTASAVAAKAATNSVPIVFAMAANPVDLRLVESLGRPGGNATGLTNSAVEVGPKLFELLRDMVPTATRIALLVNPTSPLTQYLLRDAEAAARTLRLELHVARASTTREVEAAFAAVSQSQAGALVIAPDSFFSDELEELAAQALRHRMPAIYATREFALAGGFASYGASIAETYRLAGVYAGRILNGEKPADLPVQQVAKVELIINLKTAKVLGLDIPPSLLARADEVIE
ncbi:MAG TPA: ABC transporter substrate-binding protein [Stellaceae bacterium]|nr:ABC transporter substrate-binding protein [Stellaceae bacterium]